MRPLIILRIKAYNLNKKMRARVISIRNKASSKNNAACTSTDDHTVKNMLMLVLALMISLLKIMYVLGLMI